jgi:thioredoxin 1
MPLTTVTDDSWAQLVTRHPGVTLVDVWAAWCTPCQALTPVLEALAQRHAGALRVLALDADANPATVATLGVRALPTVLLFREGVEQRRLVGAQSLAAYEAALEAVLRGEGAAPAAAPVAHEPEDPAHRDAAALLASAAPLLLFKHSRTCPISHAAHAQLEAFRRTHPAVPVRVLVVQEERALSQAVAHASGVRHESPQALLLHGGGVRWHASHGAVTAARLAAAWAEALAVVPPP